MRQNVFYAGSGLKSDYAGHDKHFHGNLGIGLSLPCGVGTQYKPGHEDQCYNNTIVMRSGQWRQFLPAHNSSYPSDQPWVSMWACDVKQQQQPRCGTLGSAATGGPSSLAKVHSNTVLNMNQTSGDVQCGGPGPSNPPMSAAEFRGKCGVDVGTSAASRPGAAEIEAMVRRWSGLPAAQ